MREAEISLLLALTEGGSRLTNLAKSLRLSASYASRIVSNLEARGFVRREGRIIHLSQNSKSELLKQLSNKFDLYRLLRGRNEEILIALLTSSTVPELLNSTRLSYETLRRSLNSLEPIGAVSRSDGVYSIVDPQVRFLIEMLQLDNLSVRVETYSQVLWSKGDLIIKRVPRGRQATGTLTAFSRFSEYGVDVRTPFDYYVSPEARIGPEEALIHALRVVRGADELGLCCIFYLKNKTKLKENQVGILVQRFGLSELWAAMQEYLRTGEPQIRNPAFPSWTEFTEKAQLYNVRLNRAIPRMKPEDVLKAVGTRLDSPTEVYLLGGENLRLKGLKVATKDIDIVVKDSKHFATFVKALRKIGYKPLAEEYFSVEDRKVDPSIILVSRGLPRIDVWTGRIAKKLKLLPTMQKRAEGLRYGELRVGLLSNEDLFLLKAVADREIELLDLQSLAETPRFNWAIVWKTLQEEEAKTKRHYCLSLLHVLDRLAETRRIRTPIQQKLVNHALDYLIPKAIGSSKRGIGEIERNLEADVPRYQLRNRLEALVRQGVLRKTKDDRKALYQLA